MKNKIIALILSVFIAISLCGCSMPEGSKDYEAHANLCEIKEEKSLYYHKETNIIYLVYNEYSGECAYGYMSPYYSENGKLCRYIDGEIVEIEE